MKFTKNKAIIVLLATSTLTLIFWAIITYNRTHMPTNQQAFNTTQKAKLLEPQPAIAPMCEVNLNEVHIIEPIASKSYINIDRQDLVRDITQNYPTIPTRAKREIVDTIVEVSKQYNINPLILYAMCHVESSMNPYEIHKEMIITIGDKKLKINAKGLAGIVFEWWGEKLINAGIITNRADLLDPILNIRSLGFIYNELYKMPLHGSASTKDESAMLRYFGGDFPSYSKRIDDKIGVLISDKLYR